MVSRTAVLVFFCSISMGLAYPQGFNPQQSLRSWEDLMQMFLRPLLPPKPEPEPVTPEDDQPQTRDLSKLEEIKDVLLKPKPKPTVEKPEKEIVYVDRPVYIPVYQPVQPMPMHRPMPMPMMPC